MEVNVDFLPYMEVNVGKKKKAKHGEMREKLQRFILNIEKEFHYTVKDFFA